MRKYQKELGKFCVQLYLLLFLNNFHQKHLQNQVLKHISHISLEITIHSFSYEGKMEKRRSKVWTVSRKFQNLFLNFLRYSMTLDRYCSVYHLAVSVFCVPNARRYIISLDLKNTGIIFFFTDSDTWSANHSKIAVFSHPSRCCSHTEFSLIQHVKRLPALFYLYKLLAFNRAM